MPPDSSGKSRATKHALLNSAALALFSRRLAGERRLQRTVLPLVLQGIGAAAISLGGWLGGTLAYRNQIGVDHRYAQCGQVAGRDLENADPATLSAAAHGLDFNQMKLVHAGDRRSSSRRTGKGYAAFADRCTHRGGPLSDGVLMCGTVQCPWHGSQFDVQTGEVKCGPAKENIATYPIEDKPARTA